MIKIVYAFSTNGRERGKLDKEKLLARRPNRKR